MTSVNISSNIFDQVRFPLVVGNRYFSVRTDEKAKLVLSVFRLDQATGRPIYEVKNGEPCVEGVTQNPTGILTFSSTAGGFLFKFRPNPKQSQFFGRIPGDKDNGLEVVCTDQKLEARLDGNMLVSVSTSMFRGFAIGIQIGEDGSVAIGSNDVPPVLMLATGA